MQISIRERYLCPACVSFLPDNVNTIYWTSLLRNPSTHRHQQQHEFCMQSYKTKSPPSVSHKTRPTQKISRALLLEIPPGCQRRFWKSRKPGKIGKLGESKAATKACFTSIYHGHQRFSGLIKLLYKAKQKESSTDQEQEKAYEAEFCPPNAQKFNNEGITPHPRCLPSIFENFDAA